MKGGSIIKKFQSGFKVPTNKANPPSNQTPDTEHASESQRKLEKEETLAEALSRVTEEVLESHGYHAVSPEHLCLKQTFCSSSLTVPLIERETGKSSNTEKRNLNETIWKNTCEKYGFESSDLGNTFRDYYGRTAIFIGPKFDGTFSPRLGVLDLYTDKSKRDKDGPDRRIIQDLSSISVGIKRARGIEEGEEKARLLLIARYKEPSSVLYKEHLPLEIFKYIYLLAVPKKKFYGHDLHDPLTDALSRPKPLRQLIREDMEGSDVTYIGIGIPEKQPSVFF